MVKVLSKGISSSVVDPEPVHVGSEKDEGPKVPLLPRSCRSKGPAVVTAEALPGGSQKYKSLEAIMCQPRCLLRLFH